MTESVTLAKLKKFCLNFTVAGVSSIMAKTIIAPIERTKLILQNQESALQVLTGETKKYNGIVDCIVRITKEQGFRSLYRGNVTNIMRYFPMQSLNFAFNDQFNPLFTKLIGIETLSKRFFVKSLSGGCAGACTITILFPLEFCQTRIAVDMGGGKNENLPREFNGLRDCIRKVRRKDGYKGLYFGFPMAAASVSLYRALYFGVFDISKYIWELHKPEAYANMAKPPIYIELLLAQNATVSSSLVLYPLDTIARRMMLDSGRRKELRLFNKPQDVVYAIYNKHGIRGFYKGALANCFRALSGAIVLVVYDEVMDRSVKNKWIKGCDNC